MLWRWADNRVRQHGLGPLTYPTSAAGCASGRPPKGKEQQIERDIRRHRRTRSRMVEPPQDEEDNGWYVPAEPQACVQTRTVRPRVPDYWPDEDNARMEGLVQELPGGDRLVIELRYLNNWDLRRVSVEIGASVATVERRLTDIHGRLQSALGFTERA